VSANDLFINQENGG